MYHKNIMSGKFSQNSAHQRSNECAEKPQVYVNKEYGDIRSEKQFTDAFNALKSLNDIKMNQQTNKMDNESINSQFQNNTPHEEEIPQFVVTTGLNTSQSKMPVSELQEYCVSRKLPTPEYSLIRNEGPSHSPTFVMQVIINGIAAGEGIGNTKQLAKHNAAKNILAQLWQNPNARAPDLKDSVINEFSKLRINDGEKCDSLITTKLLSSSSSSSITDQKPININSGMNPVSALQELCVKKHWNAPDYNWNCDKLNHEQVFVCTCTLKIDDKEVEGKGYGRNKQIAKSMAAEKTIENLSKNIHINYIINSSNRGAGECSNSISHNVVCHPSSTVDRASVERATIDAFEKILLNAELNSLLDSEISNYCHHLHVIGNKLKFKCDYFEFIDATLMKCLLHITKESEHTTDGNLQIITSWGRSTVSMDEAKQMAAKIAIMMLKILKTIN